MWSCAENILSASGGSPASVHTQSDTENVGAIWSDSFAHTYPGRNLLALSVPQRRYAGANNVEENTVFALDELSRPVANLLFDQLRVLVVPQVADSFENAVLFSRIARQDKTVVGCTQRHSDNIFE